MEIPQKFLEIFDNNENPFYNDKRIENNSDKIEEHLKFRK